MIRKPKPKPYTALNVGREHIALAKSRTAFLLETNIAERSISDLIANAYLQGMCDLVEYTFTPHEGLNSGWF